MTFKKKEKIAVFVAVVLAFAFFVFTSSLFQSDSPLSLDDIISNDSSEDDGDLDEADGLSVNDVAVGEGDEALEGSVITVHYILALDDGTEIESSRDSAPFSFLLGGGQVIPGWDRGIRGMKVGGVRILTIPPELAYGANGSGPIPPNSTLVFEVELLSVETP